ncbi:MAG: hypothetical protein AAFY59_16115 [Pseudomonadota bacterium]
MSWENAELAFAGIALGSVLVLAISTLVLLRTIRTARFFTLLFWFGVLGTVVSLVDEQVGFNIVPQTPETQVMIALLVFAPMPICLMAVALQARRLRLTAPHLTQVFE